MNSFLIENNGSIKKAISITKLSIDNNFYLVYALQNEDVYDIYASLVKKDDNGEHLINIINDDDRMHIFKFISVISRNVNNDLKYYVLDTKKKENIRLRSSSIDFKGTQRININEDKLMLLGDNIFNKLKDFFDKLNYDMTLLKKAKEDGKSKFKYLNEKGYTSISSNLVFVSIILTIIEYFLIMFIR